MDELIQNQGGDVPRAGDYPASPMPGEAVAPTQDVISQAAVSGEQVQQIPVKSDQPQASVLDAQKPVEENSVFSSQTSPASNAPKEQILQTPMKEDIKTSGKSPALMIGIIVLLVVAVIVLMKFRSTAAPSLPQLDTSAEDMGTTVAPPADDTTQVINQQLEQIQINDVSPEFQQVDQDLNTL